MARSNENHLKRARERINQVHEAIDALETQLNELRGQTARAEDALNAAVRAHVDAKTAEVLEQLERKG